MGGGINEEPHKRLWAVYTTNMNKYKDHIIIVLKIIETLMGIFSVE